MNSTVLSLESWYHSNLMFSSWSLFVFWSNKINQSKEQSWFLSQLFDIQYYLHTFLGLNSILCGYVTEGLNTDYWWEAFVSWLLEAALSFRRLPVVPYMFACLVKAQNGGKTLQEDGHYGAGGLVAKSCLTLETPWTLCSWDSPSKNTRVGCISFSRGSSWPRSWTQVSCTAGRFFTSWGMREAQDGHYNPIQFYVT